MNAHPIFSHILKVDQLLLNLLIQISALLINTSKKMSARTRAHSENSRCPQTCFCAKFDYKTVRMLSKHVI